MAELVEEVPVTKGAAAVPAVAVVRPRISWGAIFGGAVSALGIWLLMYAFALAVGLSAIKPNDPGSLRSSSVFTGVWGLVAPLVSLFVGGMVAGRLSGAGARGAGAVHGLVVWGLATAVGAYLMAATVAAVIGGVASMGRGAATGMSGQGPMADDGPASGLSIDADDALAPVNHRLEAEGKSPISVDQLRAATHVVAEEAIQTGRFDRSAMAAALAQNTELSPADAQEVAARVESQWDQWRLQMRDAAEAAQGKALEAAKASGKAFWGVFAALLLGLGAALVGGAIGGRGPRRRWWRRERLAPKPAPTTTPPLATQREVYP
jgi:hypothetical protein